MTKRALQSRTTARTLFIVQNQSVPADRRVWLECTTLREAGYDVAVISPTGEERDTAPHETIDGIAVHRYQPRPAAGSQLSYIGEYASAVRAIRRTIRGLHDKQFEVVHIANPPDLLFLTLGPLKRRGARVIYDQHDVVPELYESRFGTPRASMLKALRTAERMTFRSADVVISTNETYRRIAITRGRKRPEDVFVVRNGPDLSYFSPVAVDETLKRGKPFLIGYLGTIGAQDGVDHAIRALSLLRKKRQDWHAVIAGDGDALPDVKTLVSELALDDMVTFPGRITGTTLLSFLSTADVCVAPEPKTPFNDASTLMKVAEYMAMARPVAAYDLTETRATAADTAVYATPGEPESLMSCVNRLLDDPELRTSLGQAARRLVEENLSWEHSRPNLLRAYEHALKTR